MKNHTCLTLAVPAATRPTIMDVEVEEDCNKTVTEIIEYQGVYNISCIIKFMNTGIRLFKNESKVKGKGQ